VRAGSAWPPRRSRPLLLVGGRARPGGGQPGSRATASGPMLVPVAELSAADTIPTLRAGVGDAYSGPPGRGAWSPEGAAWAISSAAPGTPLLLTRPGATQTRRGEAGLSGAAADVTTAAWLAFLCPSMVRCSWSTTGRDRALRCPLRAGHRLVGPGSPAQHGPGYDPGTMGTVPGVVARSDVDAVPGNAGQGGGPVMRHDGGHGGVDAAGESLRSLASRAPRASSRRIALPM
jgi:hypothetical protein